MRNTSANLENLTARRGVYCVWVLTREGQATRLIARWIDPATETQNRSEDQNSVENADAADVCPSTATRFRRRHCVRRRGGRRSVRVLMPSASLAARNSVSLTR